MSQSFQYTIIVCMLNDGLGQYDFRARSLEQLLSVRQSVSKHDCTIAFLFCRINAQIVVTSMAGAQDSHHWPHGLKAQIICSAPYITLNY